MEKPDWVSWETIHDVLWEAHAENRKNGVFMRYPSKKKVISCALP